MKIKNNKKASLVLLALLLVWFLLVLSVGILKVILTDSKDTYSMKNSLKAFYWAESWLELWLLRLKLKWFWYEYLLKNWERESNILWNKVFLDYKINSKNKKASWTIESWGSVIYPLFYKTGSQDFTKDSTIKDTENIKLTFTFTDWTGSLITWWLIWTPKTWTKIKWLNWTWSWWIINWNTEWITKYLNNSKKLVFTGSTISNFLETHTWSYLQIWNLNTWAITYELKWDWSQKNFTGKYTIITSSARVWKNKQSIKFKINNSEYLNIFRFTLYDTKN